MFGPYVDLIWCETSTPDIGEAREFARAIHEKYPGKLLAYNCSPSFNWKRNLNDRQIASFQEQLAEMGYKFQFITLAGFHTLKRTVRVRFMCGINSSPPGWSWRSVLPSSWSPKGDSHQSCLQPGTSFSLLFAAGHHLSSDILR